MRGWRGFGGTAGFIPRKARSGSTPRRYIETDLQILLVDFFKSTVPRTKADIISISQGHTNHSKRKAAMLKRLGLRAGVSDLLVIMKGGATIWIEVKRPEIDSPAMGKIEKGRLSKSQMEFRDLLKDLNHKFEVVSTPAEFLKILKENGLVAENTSPPLFMPQL